MSPDVVFWLTVSIVGLSLTVYAEREATRDAEAVRSLNGSIVGITVRGELFQERLRLVVQVIFVVVGVLALTRTAEHLIVPLLLTVPVILAANTLRGLQDRRLITGKSQHDVTAERDRRMDRLEDRGSSIEAKLDANTALTQQASDNATAAYEAANDLNERISAQDVAIIEQGANAAADRLVGVEDKVTDTRERVIDLQDRADGK